MNTLTNVLWVACFAVGLNFCISYHLLAPWRSSVAGFNVMTFMATSTGLLGLRVLAIIFGEGYWGQDLIRVLFLVAWLAIAGHRWVMLMKAQRRNLDGAAEPHA